LLLRFDVDVLEDVSGERVRQNPKDDHLLVLGKIENNLGDIRRRHFRKKLAQRGEVPRFDHALDFGQENFADHGAGWDWWSSGVVVFTSPAATLQRFNPPELHYSTNSITPRAWIFGEIGLTRLDEFFFCGADDST
jgi:hypothetical protein